MSVQAMPKKNGPLINISDGVILAGALMNVVVIALIVYYFI